MHAIFIAGLRLLSVLVGLVYVKYYTNTLSLEQVGVFFYLGTLSYLLNALVFVPIDLYMQARLSTFGAIPWRAVLRLVAVTLLVALVICLLLSIPFFIKGLLAICDVPLLYGLAVLLYLCSSLRNLINIRGYALFSSFMIVLETVARLITFFLMVRMFGASARTLLFSSIMALTVELIVLICLAHRKLPLSTDAQSLDYPIQILLTASTLAGGAVSNTVQLQAFRVIFPAAGYAQTSATLGVVANIGAVAMSSCSQAYSQVFLPRLYQTRGGSISQYIRWGVVTALGLMAVALPLSKFIVRHLTRAEYVPYADAIGVGIMIEAGNMLIGAYGVYLILHGRTSALFLFQLGGAVLSLSGCLTLLLLTPNSPMLLGLVVVVSQLAVTSGMAFFVYNLEKEIV